MYRKNINTHKSRINTHKPPIRTKQTPAIGEPNEWGMAWNGCTWVKVDQKSKPKAKTIEQCNDMNDVWQNGLWIPLFCGC